MAEHVTAVLSWQVNMTCETRHRQLSTHTPFQCWGVAKLGVIIYNLHQSDLLQTSPREMLKRTSWPSVFLTSKLQRGSWGIKKRRSGRAQEERTHIQRKASTSQVWKNGEAPLCKESHTKLPSALFGCTQSHGWWISSASWFLDRGWNDLKDSILL